MQCTNMMKTIRIKPDASGYTVAAGSSAVTSDPIDTSGFEGVRIITGFGALTSGAVTSQKVQQATATGGSYADLLASSITVADDDDNQITVIDIYRPQELFLKVVTSRATQNAVIDFMIVELYCSRTQPVDTADATVISTEKHVSPAEGTA